MPKPSGFIGGIYLGCNVDLGNVLILGVETDAVRVDRGETKTVSKILTINDFNDEFEDAGVTLDENEKFQKGYTAVYRIGFKEKRFGATRVRVGFSVADRIMPYVAGSIAYA